MPYCDLTGDLIRIANIESDVADHCNLSCAGCNHFAPYFRPGFYNIHDFKKDIEALVPVLRADCWYLLGGEPLLNPRLTDYARALRDSGICNQIAVWTNGLLLPTWKDQELFTLIDTVVISRYPGLNYSHLDAWLAENHLPCKLQTIGYGAFLHSLSPQGHSDTVAQNIFDGCRPRRSCHQVYRGAYYLCPESSRIPVLLRLPGVSDGCPLHADDLRSRLRDHLRPGRIPLGSCRYCRAYDTAAQPHHQEPVSIDKKVGF
jgi:hypothetical protein